VNTLPGKLQDSSPIL